MYIFYGANHHLSDCWLRAILPYSVNMPQQIESPRVKSIYQLSIWHQVTRSLIPDIARAGKAELFFHLYT